ncbi:hypothetical protein TNCV_567041 [Trichonephila clavipes]|nr:hypothetical protein TNCV_567041 [Trichonephila clavipes]
MDTFLSRKRTLDDNKAPTSAQTSIVPKIKSRKYSQEYLNFGFTITELDEATDSNKDAHFIAYARFWDERTEDDYLFMEESNSDGENDTDFDDVPEDITEGEYADLFILSYNERSQGMLFL